MKVFMEMVKKYLKLFFQYKMGFLLSLVIHPVVMVLSIMVFTSLYAHAGLTTMAGFTLGQMIWYMAGIPCIWVIVWNFTDWNIAEKVLNGNLTQDLLRPVSIFALELADAVGLRISGIMMEFIPDMVILSAIYFPSFMTVWSFLRFIPAAIGAFLLFFHINFLLGLLAFAMKSTKSIVPVKFIIVTTLGGGYLPLSFFPPVVTMINSVLPFQYIFYQPLMIFLNMPAVQSPAAYLQVIGAQVAWICGLHLLTRALWMGAYRKFCAVGG